MTTNFGGPSKNVIKTIPRQILQRATKKRLAIITLNILLQNDNCDFFPDDFDNNTIDTIIGIKIVKASILMKVAKNAIKSDSTAYVIHDFEKACKTSSFWQLIMQIDIKINWAQKDGFVIIRQYVVSSKRIIIEIRNDENGDLLVEQKIR